MSSSAFIANIQELDHYNNDEGEDRPHIANWTGNCLFFKLEHFNATA